MLRRIIDTSVNLRRIVLVAAVGILVLGIVQLDGSKRDLLPEFSPVEVEVQRRLADEVLRSYVAQIHGPILHHLRQHRENLRLL